MYTRCPQKRIPIFINSTHQKSVQYFLIGLQDKVNGKVKQKCKIYQREAPCSIPLKVLTHYTIGKVLLTIENPG